MKAKEGPGVFPDSLPDQLMRSLTSMNADLQGRPVGPVIDDRWKLAACRFVDGDPAKLEIIFTGIIGGRLRLTVSAKPLGQSWFEPGVLGEGDGTLTPIAAKLSLLVEETVIPEQPDVTLDIDVITMKPSNF
jgi:hypothetical protein